MNLQHSMLISFFLNVSTTLQHPTEAAPDPKQHTSSADILPQIRLPLVKLEPPLHLLLRRHQVRHILQKNIHPAFPITTVSRGRECEERNHRRNSSSAAKEKQELSLVEKKFPFGFLAQRALSLHFDAQPPLAIVAYCRYCAPRSPVLFRDCRVLLAGAEARCCTCAQIAKSLQVSRAS